MALKSTFSGMRPLRATFGVEPTKPQAARLPASFSGGREQAMSTYPALKTPVRFGLGFVDPVITTALTSLAASCALVGAMVYQSFSPAEPGGVFGSFRQTAEALRKNISRPVLQLISCHDCGRSHSVKKRGKPLKRLFHRTSGPSKTES